MQQFVLISYILRMEKVGTIYTYVFEYIYNGNFVGLMSLRMLEEDLDLIDYITIHHGDMGNGNCH